MFSYLLLTKPRISLLFALTGLTALMMEGSLLPHPWTLMILTAAIFLTGGSANAFNQYFEREIDKRMERTARKRPLPRGEIKPVSALVFAIVTGLLSIFLLWKFGSLSSAFLGLATILFYSFYYTLWLKPRTPYNIVIGGAAGATGPLIGWASVNGQISWAAFIMFLIIFFWTPPHFWALALCCKEDYSKVNYPMLPLVYGDEATHRQILGYALILMPLSTTLYFLGEMGLFYLVGSIILGVLFIAGALQVYHQKTTKACWQLFGYSIVYLLLLFVIMIADKIIA